MIDADIPNVAKRLSRFLHVVKNLNIMGLLFRFSLKLTYVLAIYFIWTKHEDNLNSVQAVSTSLS